MHKGGLIILCGVNFLRLIGYSLSLLRREETINELGSFIKAGKINVSPLIAISGLFNWARLAYESVAEGAARCEANPEFPRWTLRSALRLTWPAGARPRARGRVSRPSGCANERGVIKSEWEIERARSAPIRPGERGSIPPLGQADEPRVVSGTVTTADPSKRASRVSAKGGKRNGRAQGSQGEHAPLLLWISRVLQGTA